MTSDLQIAANQQNAQNSTGPKSQSARQRTRNNAVKHGIFSRQLLITGEDPEELAALQSDVGMALAPEGVFEEMFVGQIIGDMWRLRRLDLAEQAYLENTKDAVFKAMAQSLSPNELSQFAANYPDPVRLRSAVKRDSSHHWDGMLSISLGKAPEDVMPPATEVESKVAIERIADRADNLGSTFLNAVAPAGGRFPMAELDRLRRGLMRDIMQKRAALDDLQERRTVIEAD